MHGKLGLVVIQTRTYLLLLIVRIESFLHMTPISLTNELFPRTPAKRKGPSVIGKGDEARRPHRCGLDYHGQHSFEVKKREIYRGRRRLKCQLNRNPKSGHERRCASAFTPE
jgi:hypothetical protein